MNDQSKNAVIVGGGIAGLFAGLLLAREGKHNIHLIERDAQLGGLLRSTQFRGGLAYDMGIHYAIETGVAEIDSILFDELTEDAWHIFTDSLPEGHVFGGQLNRESGCIDARSLRSDLYAQGLVELLDGHDAPADVKNLAEELRTEYGPTFAERIYRPAIRKLTGRELETLAPGTHRRFHIPRLIALPSHAAKRLKKLPEYDKRIAYTKISDGHSAIRKFYPRQGGIGMWPETLARRLTDAGAQIHTGASVDSVVADNERIASVTLSGGEVLPCDLLIWSVSMPLLARALGVDISSAAPIFRHVLLLHYLFEGGVTPDLHWVSVYDEQFAAYRVTLYDNIAPSNHPDGSRVTVEVLRSETGGDVEKLAGQVINELRSLGLVADTRTGDFVGHEWVTNAFPVEMSDREVNSPAPNLIDSFANLVAVGRNTGSTFSQAAILEAVMSGIERHVGL